MKVSTKLTYKEKSENLKVVVRVRPPLPREMKKGKFSSIVRFYGCLAYWVFRLKYIIIINRYRYMIM